MVALLVLVALAANGGETTQAASSTFSVGTPRSLAETKDSTTASASKDGSTAAAKPENAQDKSGSAAAAAPSKPEGAEAKAPKKAAPAPAPKLKIPTGLGHGDPDPTAVWRESPKQADIAAKVALALRCL